MKLVVVGAQWGDEGKGKIVDFLAKDASLIVRFSGGANAGHTIVHEGTTYKLHLIPSGIIYPDKTVILGTAMVIDPEALFGELDTLSDLGVDWNNRVLISDRAHVVLPGYREIDKKRDQERKHPLGTTGRGIGISYAQKSSREGIRMVDMFEPARLVEVEDDDKEFLGHFRDKLKPMLIDISSFMRSKDSKQMLFEGAQGIMLDLDIGTYPFVSSGNSTASGAAIGGGIGPRALDRIIGVFKAYSTRVGNGPFPSEFSEERDGTLSDTIRELGREYGVTTGRPRRCGYLDLVALRYACKVSSIDSLALTHIDVYDTFDEVRVCTAYRYNGKEIRDFPASIAILEEAEPVLQSFRGWKTSLSEARVFEELPAAARSFISFIEEYTETPVDIVSVGYERKQTILKIDPWH
jgi:adenylosuccinate synthase